MKPYLYYNELDDDKFPDMKIGPGRKGINARVVPPPGDARVPAPPKAILLLVAFRLDEPGPQRDPAVPAPAWELSFDQADRLGVVQRQRIALMPTPPPGDHVERVKPDPTMPRVTGQIYRGVLWADLDELYQHKVLRAGMVAQLSFGQQAQTPVQLV